MFKGNLIFGEISKSAKIIEKICKNQQEKNLNELGINNPVDISWYDDIWLA